MGHEIGGCIGQEITMRKLRHCIYCHRPDLIRLADRPSALQTAHLRRPSPGWLESGFSAAEGPLAPGLGKARDDAFRRRSIGILAGTAQGWLRCEGQTYYRLGIMRLTALCALPFTSPTFHRIPGRYCAYAAAWASRRISSSQRDFRPPTAPFAAPEWITLRQWPSPATRHGSIAKRGGGARPVAWFYSPRRRASPISTLPLRRTTCCCSAANP